MLSKAEASREGLGECPFPVSDLRYCFLFKEQVMREKDLAKASLLFLPRIQTAMLWMNCVTPPSPTHMLKP